MGIPCFGRSLDCIVCLHHAQGLLEYGCRCSSFFEPGCLSAQTREPIRTACNFSRLDNSHFDDEDTARAWVINISWPPYRHLKRGNELPKVSRGQLPSLISTLVTTVDGFFASRPSRSWVRHPAQTLQKVKCSIKSRNNGEGWWKQLLSFSQLDRYISNNNIYTFTTKHTRVFHCHQKPTQICLAPI